MCTMRGQVPRKARRGHWIPGIEVIGSCELFNDARNHALYLSQLSSSHIKDVLHWLGGGSAHL